MNAWLHDYHTFTFVPADLNPQERQIVPVVSTCDCWATAPHVIGKPVFAKRKYLPDTGEQDEVLLPSLEGVHAGHLDFGVKRRPQ